MGHEYYGGVEGEVVRDWWVEFWEYGGGLVVWVTYLSTLCKGRERTHV